MLIEPEALLSGSGIKPLCALPRKIVWDLNRAIEEVIGLAQSTINENGEAGCRPGWQTEWLPFLGIVFNFNKLF